MFPPSQQQKPSNPETSRLDTVDSSPMSKEFSNAALEIITLARRYSPNRQQQSVWRKCLDYKKDKPKETRLRFPYGVIYRYEKEIPDCVRIRSALRLPFFLTS